MRNRIKSFINNSAFLQKYFFSFFMITLIATVLWLVKHPNYFPIAFVICLSIPIITIFIFGFKESAFMTFVRLEETKDGKHLYHLNRMQTILVTIPLFSIVFSFNFENSFFTYFPVGIFSLFIGVRVFLPMHTFKADRWAKPKKVYKPRLWLSIMIGLGFLLYLSGVVYGFNCIFDNSKPVTYNVKILSKQIQRKITKRRRHNYYIIVTPWADLKNPKKVKIESLEYQHAKIDDIIQIYRKNGLLGMAWYYPSVSYKFPY